MQNILQPSQYVVVQEVFKAIARAEWFDRNIENEKACARLVLMTFGDGNWTQQQLYERCIEVARDRFARQH